MPWTALSGKTYKLALFDTNALSEIVKRPGDERKGIMSLIASEPIAPCFTPYNLIELYHADGVFESFLELFSMIPTFVTKPNEAIHDEELSRYGTQDRVLAPLNAFTPYGPDESYSLRYVVTRLFSDPEVRTSTARAIGDAQCYEVLEVWKAGKSNFVPHRDVANAADADRFVSEAGMQTIIRLFPAWANDLIGAGQIPDATAFPSILTMLYSQYWRLWDKDWKLAPGDVRDIQIAGVSPYVDIVVTEKRQAEIMRKIRNKVWGLEDLRVMTLGDLRDCGA